MHAGGGTGSASGTLPLTPKAARVAARRGGILRHLLVRTNGAAAAVVAADLAAGVAAAGKTRVVIERRLAAAVGQFDVCACVHVRACVYTRLHARVQLLCWAMSSCPCSSTLSSVSLGRSIFQSVSADVAELVCSLGG